MQSQEQELQRLRSKRNPSQARIVQLSQARSARASSNAAQAQTAEPGGISLHSTGLDLLSLPYRSNLQLSNLRAA